jgi:glycosyltransferase involved in cell wall biosynthesis
VKIYVFPADTSGCGYYRLIWPAEVLQARGHDVTIVVPKRRDEMLQGKMSGDTMVDVKIPSDADVIVFQRVTHRHLVQAISLIRKRGIAVVVDMDDDLTCIHPANPAFAALHPRNGNRDHSWENTLRACANATMVTVSTPALISRYAKRTAGRVLYNMVPERALDVPRIDSAVVGWAGSVHSHPTDLQMMGPAIAQHLQHRRQFKIVGPLAGVHEALGVSRSVEIETTDVVRDIYAWPLAVASIGIGVAPLADSKFNTAKSWLKMAEYAAAGVPCIASPRDEYVRLHRRGVGLLAKNPTEWRQRINALVASESLRTDLSEAGREVMRDLTIERNAELWLEPWNDAYKIQRQGVSNPLARVTV